MCLQLNHPDLVDGLVLINIDPNAEGIMDSVANKVSYVKLCAIYLHNLKDMVSETFNINTFEAIIITSLNAMMCMFCVLQITEWTQTVPDTVITHLFGKVTSGFLCSYHECARRNIPLINKPALKFSKEDHLYQMGFSG